MLSATSLPKPLSPRQFGIIKYLIEQNKSVTTENLAKYFSISVRTIRNDLMAIEQWCRDVSIDYKRDHLGGIEVTLPTHLRGQIDKVLGLSVSQNLGYRQDSRLNRLLIELFTHKDPIVVKQLPDILQVSSRTIYSDLDVAEKWLQRFTLKLIRKPNFGLIVEGDELAWRNACYGLLNKCLNLSEERLESGAESLLDEYLKYRSVWPLERFFSSADLQALSWLVERLGVMLGGKFAASSHSSLVLQMGVLLFRLRRGYPLSLGPNELESLRTCAEYEVASLFAEWFKTNFQVSLSDGDIGFVTLNVLAARLRNDYVPKDGENDLNDPQIEKLVWSMLEIVDLALGLPLSSDTVLWHGLLQHIKPMLYRVSYGITLQNELVDQIKENHALAYHAAVLAAQCVEKKVGKLLNSSEIGYMAMHFGAAIERIKNSDGFIKPLRVMVVCGNGIGTSSLLISRVETNIPRLKVIKQISVGKLNETGITADVDFILSTVKLPSAPLPCFVVNPLLPIEEIVRLSVWLNEQFGTQIMAGPRQESMMNNILRIIEKHTRIINRKELLKELHQLILSPQPGIPIVDYKNPVLKHQINRDRRVPMLLDLLTEETIQLRLNVKDRDELIELASAPLLQQGLITPSYIKAMQASLNQNGPYVVIVPEVAILHARPEDGVSQVCMSLTTVENGIFFGHPDNDPVKIAIVFGAVDKEMHIGALSELVNLLSKPDTLDEIKKATVSEQVLDIIRRILK